MVISALTSAPDIARVEASRDAGVGRALDNRAAIGEESHFKGLMPEFKYEVVVPDGAVGLQAGVHF